MSGQHERLPVLHVIRDPTWQDELCPQLTACDSSQRLMVLKPFECQHSCPRMRVLSVYQVKARVVQSERQAGMAVAYRKLLIEGENIFED